MANDEPQNKAFDPMDVAAVAKLPPGQATKKMPPPAEHVGANGVQGVVTTLQAHAQDIQFILSFMETIGEKFFPHEMAAVKEAAAVVQAAAGAVTGQ